jgi:hypothetical protein
MYVLSTAQFLRKVSIIVLEQNKIGPHEAGEVIKRLYPWDLFPVTREETSAKDAGKSSDRRASRREAAGGATEVHPVVESLHKFGITTSVSTDRQVSDVRRVSDVEADVVITRGGSSCTVRVCTQV